MKKLYCLIHDTVTNCILLFMVKFYPAFFTKIFYDRLYNCNQPSEFSDMLDFCQKWQKHIFLNRGLVESAWDKMAWEKLRSFKPDELYNMSRIVRPNSPIIKAWIERSARHIENKLEPDSTDADEVATLLQFARDICDNVLIARTTRLAENIHEKTGQLVIREGGSKFIFDQDGNITILSI